MSYVNDFCDTVEKYYEALKSCNPITREEEHELIQLAQEGDILSQNKVLQANLKFVFDVAKTYKGYGVPLPELISEGNMGMIKALTKFDNNRGVKFISYAVWWIRQAIQECIKKNITSKANEVDLDEINSQNSEKQSVITDYEPESIIFIDTSPDDQEAKQKNEAVVKLLQILPDRERNVLLLYYGFDGEEKTLDEIGIRMGITKERVRQIKENAIRKLRTAALMEDNF